MVDVEIVVIKMNKVEMKNLDISERIKNFEEVALGYDDQKALEEASRCLNCPNPRCVSGCPVNIQIPKFIECIKNNDLEKAYKIINEASLLPAICGRVCPQEKQCEAMCIKGFRGDAISIGSLERYVADWAIKNKINVIKQVKSNGKKVAIIGSGPSGLTCASELARLGYDVTIYEALHKPGGVLTYGIPEFRLPKDIVAREIDNLQKMGVKIILNVIIGKSLDLEDLENEYDAIYIATGAGLPKFMGIENENANGVFSANEILTRINLMGAYQDDTKTPIMKARKVVVVGGGNVAMDAARSMRRLGSEVHLVYRRGMDELPARKEEVKHAIEEGIIFDILTNPTKVLVDDNNFVTGIEVIDMELDEVDASGRKSVRVIPNSNHEITCDMVIMALGTKTNLVAIEGTNIKTDKGLIVAEGTKTSCCKIFAGGDAVTGSATVILAMEAGKKAAKEIDEYQVANNLT